MPNRYPPNSGSARPGWLWSGCAAADAWDALSDFGAVNERLVPGFVTNTRLDGAGTRVVTFYTGAVARERLIGIDHDARRLAYTLVETTLNPTHHSASASRTRTAALRQEDHRLATITGRAPAHAAARWHHDDTVHDAKSQVTTLINSGAQDKSQIPRYLRDRLARLPDQPHRSLPGSRQGQQRWSMITVMTERQAQSRTDLVQVGVLLPSRETAMTGEHDGPGLIAFAGAAEAAGFDSVWAGDSPLARMRMDPMPLLAAAAAATKRVGLGTAAFTAALRNPLLAAHSAASVDQLSGGRLILGLGAGFPIPESRREFETLGVPFAGRSGRLDEMVALWRYLWTTSPPAEGFAGEHWKLEARSGLLPAARSGGPPLWLAGGDTAGVIQRTAALYDGWLPFVPDSIRYTQAWQDIRDRASQLGREVTPGLYATIHLDDDEDHARNGLDSYLRAYYRRPLTEMAAIQASFAGSPQHCLEWLGRYIDAGARYLVLRLGSIQPRTQLDAAGELLPFLQTITST